MARRAFGVWLMRFGGRVAIYLRVRRCAGRVMVRAAMRIPQFFDIGREVVRRRRSVRGGKPRLYCHRCRQDASIERLDLKFSCLYKLPQEHLARLSSRPARSQLFIHRSEIGRGLECHLGAKKINR